MREMLMRIGGDDPDERSKHGVPGQPDLTTAANTTVSAAETAATITASAAKTAVKTSQHISDKRLDRVNRHHD